MLCCQVTDGAKLAVIHFMIRFIAARPANPWPALLEKYRQAAGAYRSVKAQRKNEVVAHNNNAHRSIDAIPKKIEQSELSKQIWPGPACLPANQRDHWCEQSYTMPTTITSGCYSR